jgi:hypothetical protein
MAFNATTVQPVAKPSVPTTLTHDHSASILAAVVLSVYAAKKSKKGLRRLKRTAMVALFRHRLQQQWYQFRSFFSKKAKPQSISNQTLIYILIGLLVLILLFVSPIAAIAVLLLGILLVLLLRAS